MRHIFIIVGALLFLSSCTLGNKISGSDDAQKPTGQSYTETIAQASSKIKDTPQFEDCMRPSVNMCLTQVGNELAREQKSTAFCDEMSDVSSRDACKYGVLISQINEQSDMKVCDELTEPYKSECRIYIATLVARSSSDITKCDSIQSEQSASGSTESANRVEQCYLSVIMQKSDSTEASCDVMMAGPNRDTCISFLKSRPKVPVFPSENTTGQAPQLQ